MSGKKGKALKDKLGKLSVRCQDDNPPRNSFYLYVAPNRNFQDLSFCEDLKKSSLKVLCYLCYCYIYNISFAAFQQSRRNVVHLFILVLKQRRSLDVL